MRGEYEVMEQAKEFSFPGSKVGVLVVHGFTGSTQSVRYLGEQIADAGYTVYGPRLTGHGTDPKDMETAIYADWLQDVEHALEKLQERCSTIFVTGLSMGGTLTLYLAEKYPEVAGMMPINAAINLPDMHENYAALKKDNTRFIAGIGSDIKKPNTEELAYKETPVKSMGELLALTKLVRDNLSNISIPALIFSSTIDHVVPPHNSENIYITITSVEKEKVNLENSYHVATLDYDQEMIAEKCIEFIKRHEH